MLHIGSNPKASGKRISQEGFVEIIVRQGEERLYNSGDAGSQTRLRCIVGWDVGGVVRSRVPLNKAILEEAFKTVLCDSYQYRHK